MVACPSVKSDVDCHNVCFLGCGFISLKNRGGLDNCIEQNASHKRLLAYELPEIDMNISQHAQTHTHAYKKHILPQCLKQLVDPLGNWLLFLICLTTALPSYSSDCCPILPTQAFVSHSNIWLPDLHHIQRYTVIKEKH